MGALARFLLILDKLVKGGTIKKIDQALKFAKNEFGEVTPLIKKQIEKVFKTAKKPQVGTPAKKEASITPIREGIETLADAKVADEGSALMDRLTKNIEDAKKPVDLDSTENVRSAIKNLEDQTRLGGDESNIRAALREFLERRLKDGTLNIPDGAERDAIEKVYQGGVDPIDVFRKAYGEDAIIAVSDVFEQFSDEIVRGANNYKELGDNFEKYFRRNRGFYDEVLPVPKEKYGYDEGLMSNQEYADKLRKDLKEKEMLEDFDPTDRTKNAEGGIMRASYAIGSGIKLAVFLARKGKDLMTEIKKAVDNIMSSGDSKYDADVAVDNMLDDLEIDRSLVDQKDVMDAYGKAYNMLAKERGLMSTKVPGGMKPESSTQVFKDSEGGIKGITMGGDKDFQKAMSEAMDEGMRESENMRRLGLDPTKMDDALKYDEMKEAGQLEKNVTGSADLSPVEELKREFPGITDEMIENILTDTDPQRIAEVKQTMREAMAMEQKGMSVDEIINTFKNQKRTKQATGGRVRAASGGLAKILNL